MQTRVEQHGGASAIEVLGDGVALPRHFTARFSDDPELPYDVTLEVVLDGGRLVCNEATFTRLAGREPVTSEGLRRLPIAKMLQVAAYAVLLEAKPAEYRGDEGHRIAPAPDIPADLADKGPTEEALRHVAAQYRLAYACGLPPTNSVAERLGLTRSTAGRWVMLARERGYLGATTAGRAGGVIDDAESVLDGQEA